VNAVIRMTPRYPYSMGSVDVRGVVDPQDERRRGDDDREALPDAPEQRCEREHQPDEQHRDEHAEPHERVEPSVGQGQHVRSEEQAPGDPQGHPGQEGKADVDNVVAEAILAVGRLEGRVAEP
jgi:hypothetical protein